MREEVVVWGPATIANWGPGFDLMGAAVSNHGDRITAKVNFKNPGKIHISSIAGDGGKLPMDAEKNTAGIAAKETLKIIGRTDIGIDISLEKGLPLGSGLGSSGASAAAAAHAVNLLCDSPVEKKALLPALLKAENAVSGWHADNVAPALLGGFVIVYSYKPLSIQCLPTPKNLSLVLITPAISIHTRDARQVVPQQISLKQHIHNNGYFGAFISALYAGDTALLGHCIQDCIVEPARSSLIPGFHDVKQAALDAGAYGCSISGAGPTMFAISDNPTQAAAIAETMKRTFLKQGLESAVIVTTIDTLGTREIDSNKPMI